MYGPNDRIASDASRAGAAADYTLYVWVVSATPGGDLTVDSAPGSATLSVTETIDFSWTGATAGQWHLGAVSHSDGSVCSA